MITRRTSFEIAAVACAVALATTLHAQTPKTFPTPARTAWTPVGCRTVGSTDTVFASRAAWRNLHSDEVNTDEVSIAYAPLFTADWVAEPGTWNPTGPVFDDAGNLYFTPLRPYESVALVSLDPATGARRWSIPNTTGAPVGSGTPMVLDDPDHPGEQIVYVGLYDRAFAVRTDGSVLWDVPTGLTGPTRVGVFGVNYHPGADAIVGITQDGWIWALDRKTGVPVLTAPFQLPGEKSPPGTPLVAPPSLLACVQTQLSTLMDTTGLTVQQLVDILLGNGVEVANFFSIDPATGRLWVGATAPDAEDGTVDGVSALGALYALDLVPNGLAWDVSEACHRSFVGGSASTVALRRDGSRAYVGDNVGNLIAIDGTCADVWSVALDGQITGSVGVAADNGEIYASTATAIYQVIDHGPTAAVAWTANLDVFDLPAGLQTFNQDLAGIGANAIAFQAGAAIVLGTQRFTVTTGMGLLDRATGQVRSFAPGLDETVAVMSTGPDGALYIGNSPIRHPFAYCLNQMGLVATPVAAPIGGIRKYAPQREDLLLRDAACAAADRAKNAVRQRRVCPLSVEADRVQVAELLRQASAAAASALAAGDLTAVEKDKVDRRITHELGRFAGGRMPKPKSLCRLAEKIVAF
jgi:outer membrane protein assembly factor BamB